MGTSGTTYGYTGEQHDSATGLLYLRARYYNPALRTFMGRDSWSGNARKPQSMNGWSYVENNPVNLTDPTGRFPEHCKTEQSKHDYIACVITNYFPLIVDPYELDIRRGSISWPLVIPHELQEGVLGEPGCYYGPIPYRAVGYLEGISGRLITGVGQIENVYNFATFERQYFVGTAFERSDDIAGGSLSRSVGVILGFRTWTDITEYGGAFAYISGGPQLPAPPPINLGITLEPFVSYPDTTIHGLVGAVSGGVVLDSFPLLRIGIGSGGSRAIGSKDTYAHGRTVQMLRLAFDIMSGWPIPIIVNGEQVAQVSISEPDTTGLISAARTEAAIASFVYAMIYQDINSQ